MQSKTEPLMEYIQMPPQINQPSRLNSLFVIPGPGSYKKIAKCRKRMESAYLGWVVINYSDNGLQFFLSDGNFYQEVRLPAGPGDKMSFYPSPWLPLKKPNDPKKVLGWDIQQLSCLVETLAKSTPYLGKFIEMVQRASATKMPTPGYAEFGSALTGRPLALTYMAWSLELVGPDWASQMDDDPASKRTLLPPDTEDKDPLEQYSFPIKIGDEIPGFDGLVGYFLPKTTEDVELGDALDLARIYSHFAIAKPAATTTTSDNTIFSNSHPFVFQELDS
ncbi:cell surface receptor IPT TIG domain protein [Fusarium tjaetaba]|uniref:Cell surface receptor IPT TIG domain protein n=1 Tax=Fusarium tjaetaba TaxID=1567544 RepID=A0A8H5W1J1_9HYPO|nr:cell surface receptor IPT TIG domain protein [Fusarium tjaetaba]KAF5643441.1 cell surface receptor IPT TIG domain protein [Fusarium tjaetaba]